MKVNNTTICEYFIKNPVTAIVLNALIVVAGLFSFNGIEVREYPDITVLEYLVETSYPNANTEIVESSITSILENAIMDVRGVDLVKSVSRFGNSTITVKMKPSVLEDRAISLIRDAITQVEYRLPDSADKPTIKNSVTAEGMPFMAIGFLDDNAEQGEVQNLYHLINTTIKDRFRSIKGIGQIQIWAQEYVLEILLDDKQLYSYAINPSDVIAALRTSEKHMPAGKFDKRIEIKFDSRPEDISHYSDIKIKEVNGKPIFLKDVASINLSHDKDFMVRINGKKAAMLAFQKSTDANALSVSEDILKEYEEIKKHLPKEIEAIISVDQAAFIRSSFNNIKSTLLESIAFVTLVVFFFLGKFRISLIPIITIPISLIGTFAIIKLLGFSINIISLLAIILAIGLVVDDAIVMLENIYRHLSKQENAVNAAIVGSNEIFFAIISMTFTLAFVYLPILFVSDYSGKLFREFAVVLSVAVIISGFVTISLTPLLSSKVMKIKYHNNKEWGEIFFHKLFMAVNFVNSKVIASKPFFAATFTIISCTIFFIHATLPKELAPKEDRGYIWVFIPPLAGTKMEELDKITSKINDVFTAIPEIETSYKFVWKEGLTFFAGLKPWEERSRSSKQIDAALKEELAKIKTFDAYSGAIDSGLPGLEFEKEEAPYTLTAHKPIDELSKITKDFVAMLEKVTLIKDPHSRLKIDSPQIKITPKTAIQTKTGITDQQISDSLEVFFGGNKNIKFHLDDKEYPILVKSRNEAKSINELYLISPSGHPVSMGSLVEVEQSIVPDEIKHLSGARAAQISFDADEKTSMKGIIDAINNIALSALPHDVRGNWTGVYQSFLNSQNTMLIILSLALIFIYSALAIQFKNFLDPIIIIFTVPSAALGSLIGLYLHGYSLNIFSQIGIITLIGLVTKNGILLVEFANQNRIRGEGLRTSALKSVEQRLRPILMTSATTLLGALPLFIASGAGSEIRNSLGVVLVYGIVFSTFFSLVIIPNSYVVVRKLFTANS